jgi:hypothetical protein
VVSLRNVHEIDGPKLLKKMCILRTIELSCVGAVSRVWHPG